MTGFRFSRSTKFGATCILAIVALAEGAPRAHADPSNFGCSNLEQDTALPTVEGKNGFFFRFAADMRMQHAFTDQAVDQLAAMAQALKASGTTLIYLPIPTKSQTMAAFLPEDAELYGFDKATAQGVYDDLIHRLEAKGVVTVNLMRALQSDNPDDPPFYKTDFHWTSSGARRAAEAVAAVIKAQPEYAGLPTSKFESVALGETTNFSTMRRIVQRRCKDNLPPVRSMAYETHEIESTGGGLDIFGGGGTGEAPVALVGTSFSDLEPANFGGFLSEYSGLSISNQAVTGGNQFGSIISYFTSAAFVDAKPRFLLWENPVYNNLGAFGSGPVEELTAAARNNCTPIPPQAVAADAGAQTLTVDLKATPIAETDIIFANAGDESSRKLEINLVRTSGIGLADTIERNARVQSSGRYFMSVAPIWSEDASTMVVKFDRFVPSQAEIGICKS